MNANFTLPSRRRASCLNLSTPSSKAEIEEIEAADWSLTPGRYVGVAPPEEDEDFDFEAALRDIHTELADLNQEAVELAARIQAHFEELGI